jgi:hypothetical protein
MIRTIFLSALYILTISSAAAQTATLQMRFVLDGDSPQLHPIRAAPAVAPPGGLIANERLLVDRENRGIKNVLVYVYTGRGGSKVDMRPNQNQVRRLTTTNGRFEPRIVIAQTGDMLELVSRGPNSYNPNLHFFINDAVNLLLRPQKRQFIPLTKPEPAPIPIDCNIHPWMRANIVVLDHPFAATSDSDGTLRIDGLPPGQSLAFQIFHEAGRSNHFNVWGSKPVNRSRFKIELSEGMNDLGDVLVPIEAFLLE